MTKRHFFMFVMALGLLFAQFAFPVNGQASPVPAGRSAAVPKVKPPVLGKELVISVLDNSKYSPAIAYNSQHDQYLVVWENVWPGGHHDIYAWRLSGTGQLLSWFAVASSSNKQMQPSVAYDPTRDRYLVTWIYDVNGDGSNWDVYGRFIPSSGPSSSLTDFAICNWASGQWHPNAAYGLAQDEFMVVWMNTSVGVPTYISGRRVYANGSGFPANAFTISSGPENRDFPDVTYNLHRNEYMVVWDVVNSNLDIYGIRLAGNGVALTGGTPSVTGEFPIAGWPDNEERPSVAACYNSDQYLVGWQSLVGLPSDSDIYARYINGDGGLAGVYLVDGTTAPEQRVDVACSRGGNQYLIAWQTMYSDGYFGIWSRLAFPNESLGDQVGLVASGNLANRTNPAVAGGQSGYLVAWEHQRDGTSYQDIYGRLVIPNTVYLPFVRR